MKSKTRSRYLVPVVGLLVLAFLAVGCAEGPATSSEPGLTSMPTEDIASTESPVSSRHHVSPDYDARQFVDSKRPVFQSEPERFEVGAGTVVEAFEGAVVSTQPRTGDYSLQEVHFTTATGQPEQGYGWVGNLKLSEGGLYDLDLVKLFHQGSEGSEIADAIQVTEGYYRVTHEKILFADELGQLLFAMDYHYNEVVIGPDDPQGYLQLRLSEAQRTEVSEAYPAYMRLHRH